MLTIEHLWCEYLENPLAVDAVQPRLSWRLRSDVAGARQEWYRIACRSGETLLWDSGWVESDECRFVRYAGLPLASRQRVEWTVTACAGGEEASSSACFVMGLLKEEDWQGKWIKPEDLVMTEARKPAIYLRRSFDVKPGLQRAVFYSTAHGLYEFWLNGERGTEDKFKPGLTSYYQRIQYHTAEVTPLLREGENVLAVILADGWWRGVTGGSVINNFGTKLAFLGQLELEYADGTREIIPTDKSFLWSSGGLRASDMLMGDYYDANLEPVGWKLPGYVPHAKTHVRLAKDHIDAKKIPMRSVPVREKERFSAREFRDAAGNRVLDFGQNIAGYVHMTLYHTRKGQRIRLLHGETLDHQGVFTQKNVKKTSFPVDVFQKVTYICRGAEMEEYQPDFAVFGFRYVLVEGDCEGNFEAIAVYSDTERTGWFSCSDPLLNQLAENSLWSQKGNFLDVPVDCPTRERNAWTGDAQIYVRTATDFMNVYPFYEKWLADLNVEQYASGKIGITFPSTSSVHDPHALAAMKENNPLYELAGPSGDGNIGEDSVGWGDAAVWIPYILYLCYGDRQILAQQYDSAKRWVDYEIRCMGEANPLYHYEDGDGQFVYDTRFHYGEWNEAMNLSDEEAPAGAPNSEAVRRFIEYMAAKGNPVVATAYVCRSCDNLAAMARVLGKTEDAGKYVAVSEKIRRVYPKYLIQEDGAIEAGHQAPYVRALAFDLCGDKREQVQSQLLHEVEANDFRLNTGFLSTPFLLPVLCDIGQTETAYRLLQTRERPGWLYPITKGLTTIPESWDGVDTLKDSLNHYSYGAVCEFLFAYVAGIRPVWRDPGYRSFELKPVPGGSLTHAEAVYACPYGEIRSAWEIRDGLFRYTCTVPVSTTAYLTMPDGSTHLLISGQHEYTCAWQGHQEGNV